LKHGGNRLVFLNEVGEFVNHNDERIVSPPNNVFEDIGETRNSWRNIIEFGRTPTGKVPRVWVRTLLVSEKVDVVVWMSSKRFGDKRRFPNPTTTIQNEKLSIAGCESVIEKREFLLPIDEFSAHDYIIAYIKQIGIDFIVADNTTRQNS
jgi:hypothetical protein